MWCQHEYGDEYFAESLHLSGRSQTLRITASPYRTTSGTWWAHSPCRVFQVTETYIHFILTYWWINGWWKMLLNLGSNFPLTFSFYVSVYLKSTGILKIPTMFDRFYRSLFQKHAHLCLWSQVLVLTVKVPPVDWLAPFGGCLRFCCEHVTSATVAWWCSRATIKSPSRALKTWRSRMLLIMVLWSLEPAWCSLRCFRFYWIKFWTQSYTRFIKVSLFLFSSFPTTLFTGESTSTWSARRALCPPWKRVFDAPKRESLPSSVKLFC